AADLTRDREWREFLVRRALEFDAANPDVVYEMGALLQQLKQPAAALPYFERHLGMVDDDQQTLVQIGKCYIDLGRLAEAEAVLQRALALADDAVGEYNLGYVLEQTGRSSEAETRYHRAIALNPGLASAHTNLGTALAGRGRVDEGAAHLAEAARPRATISGRCSCSSGRSSARRASSGSRSISTRTTPTRTPTSGRRWRSRARTARRCASSTRRCGSTRTTPAPARTGRRCWRECRWRRRVDARARVDRGARRHRRLPRRPGAGGERAPGRARRRRDGLRAAADGVHRRRAVGAAGIRRGLPGIRAARPADERVAARQRRRADQRGCRRGRGAGERG